MLLTPSMSVQLAPGVEDLTGMKDAPSEYQTTHELFYLILIKCVRFLNHSVERKMVAMLQLRNIMTGALLGFYEYLHVHGQMAQANHGKRTVHSLINVHVVQHLVVNVKPTCVHLFCV